MESSVQRQQGSEWTDIGNSIRSKELLQPTNVNTGKIKPPMGLLFPSVGAEKNYVSEPDQITQQLIQISKAKLRHNIQLAYILSNYYYIMELRYYVSSIEYSWLKYIIFSDLITFWRRIPVKLQGFDLSKYWLLVVESRSP